MGKTSQKKRNAGSALNASAPWLQPGSRWIPRLFGRRPSGKHTKKLWKITIFNEKIHYVDGHFQVRKLFVITRGYPLVI